MDLAKLWNFYSLYLFDGSEELKKYSIIDKIYYLSHFLIIAIDTFEDYNSDLDPMSKAVFRRNAFAGLHVLDTIGLQTNQLELVDFLEPDSDNIELDGDKAIQNTSFVLSTLFGFDDKKINFFFKNIETKDTQEPIEFTVSVIYDGIEFNILDITKPNESHSYYINDGCCMLSYMVYLICKATELAFLELEKIGEDINYFSINSGDMIFRTISKYILSDDGFKILSDDKYNLKNSNHLELLDKVISNMQYHPISLDENIENFTDDIIFDIECTEIQTNSSNLVENIKVPENIKEAMRNIERYNLNTWDIYDIVISKIAIPEFEGSNKIYKFPLIGLSHLSEFITDMTTIHDNDYIAINGTTIQAWLNSELISIGIPDDVIGIGYASIQSMNNIPIDKLLSENVEITVLNNTENLKESIMGAIDKLKDEYSDVKAKPIDTKVGIEDLGIVKIKHDEDSDALKNNTNSVILCDNLAKNINDNYLLMLMAQLDLNYKDIKDLSKCAYNLTTLPYSKFFSKDLEANYIQFRDYFSGSNILFNIVTRGRVINSYLFYYDDNGWNCASIFNKLNTAAAGIIASYMRSCHIDTKSELCLNISSFAGYFNCTLVDELNYLKRDKIEDFDIGLINYDVSLFCLSAFSVALTYRLIKDTNSRGEHMLTNTSQFISWNSEYKFMDTFNAMDYLISIGVLDEHDIENIKTLFEMNVSNKIINNKNNTDNSGLIITFFSRNIGRYNNGVFTLSNNGIISKPVLYKSGIPFTIVKDGMFLLMIEDLGNNNDYNFNLDFIKICNYFLYSFYQQKTKTKKTKRSKKGEAN